MHNDLLLGANDVLSKITFTPQDQQNPYAGWYDVNLPDTIHNFSRMHLNRKQAKELAKQLKYFARTGRLKER